MHSCQHIILLTLPTEVKKIFGKEMWVSGIGRQLMRNILMSWGGYAVRLTIAFLFVPYISSVYGDSRYGVWVILFQTVGYFSMMDLGLSSALTRYVSKYLSKSDYRSINRVLSTANLLYALVGIGVFLGVWLFAARFFQYFKIDDPSLMAEGQHALLLLGGFLALSFFLLPFGNTQAAFQRHDVNRFLVACEEIVRTIAMVVLIWTGHGLVALAGVIVAVSLIRHIAGIIWLRRAHPQVHFSPSLIDKATSRLLLSYSRISFAVSIGWLIMFNTDSFLLGLITSSAAAGIYNPGAQLMLSFRNLVNAIGIPLIPAVSHLEAEDRAEQIRQIYRKGVKYGSYLSFALAGGVIVFANPFVRIWLAPEFFPSAKVMIILSLGNAFFLPQILGNSILFGIARHKYILYVVAVESMMKIILALVLTPIYGLVGMALANTIPQVLLYSTLYPYLMSRVLSMSFASIVFIGLRYGMLALVIVVPISFLTARLVEPTGWVTLAGTFLPAVAATVLAGIRIIEPEDRNRVKSFLGFGE
jgi:O-antigen/teichoic acid export membrane protein